MSISDLTQKYNFTSTIGNYESKVENICGNKVYNIVSELKKTSLENIGLWKDKYKV